MSDKRRRRRKNSGSEDEEEKPVLGSDMSDHEYESAADDGHETGSDVGSEGAEEELFPKEDEGEQPVAAQETSLVVDEEATTPADSKESGGAKVDKVSVDEDRRNPAYIPKRGLFYEHDDRLESGGEEGSGTDDAAKEVGKETDPASGGGAKPADGQRPRRVFKSDVAEKWGHDKFMEVEQIPKSKEELVQVYGYDIRNEDNAPRARRRRRYGRGPNKYTRNWEDEEAYQSKPARGGGPPIREGPGRRRSEEGEELPPLQRGERGPQQSGPRPERRPQKEEHDNSDRGQRGSARGGRGRGGPPRRGGGPDRALPNQGGPRTSGGSRRQADQDANLDNVENEMSKVNLGGNRNDPRANRNNQEHHNEMGPNTGEGKPKRYSNLRPARDGQAGPHMPMDGRGQANFYEYQHTGNGTTFAGQAFPNTPNNGPPPDAPFISVPSAPAGTRMALPTPAPGNPAYINPAGGMMNYGPPPPVPYAPVPVSVPIPLVGVPPAAHHPSADPLAMIAATHLNQTFVGNPAVAVTSPEQVLLAAAAAQGGQGYAEVRGGVTYFSPTAQAMRPHVSKRPKAAIPIVDPSQVEQQSHRQSNGESKSLESQLANPPSGPNCDQMATRSTV